MDDVLAYLMNYALAHDIGVVYDTTLPPYAPPVSFVRQRMVVMNGNFRESEQPFALAHEIGHIMLGHYRFHCNAPVVKYKQEKEADDYATDLLWQCAEDNNINYVDFLATYGVPDRMFLD